MKKIKAVIFDLDGTLGNTIPLCIQAFREAVEPIVHRPLSDDEITATFGPDEEGSIMKMAPDDYKKGTTDFMRLYESLHHICPRPFDGVTDMLETLQSKGVGLALATGKGKYTTGLTLHRFGLNSYFKAIETGSPKGSRKVEALGQILQFFAIGKDEVVYVGDSSGDIKDCRKAGVAIAAAAWADTADIEKLKALQPDELFTSIDDFTSWILTKL